MYGALPLLLQRRCLSVGTTVVHLRAQAAANGKAQVEGRSALIFTEAHGHTLTESTVGDE